MRTALLFLALILAAHTITAAQPAEIRPPLLIIYSPGHHPVEEVTVSVTNPHKDRAILVTSVEFEGQLPELRYFYHGIYGSISRSGDIYKHFTTTQTLSIPVASCFLLPGQSTSWQRLLRIYTEEYRAIITWKEIAEEDMARSVWFRSEYDKNDIEFIFYEPLSKKNVSLFSNISAGEGELPYVVLEGEHPQYSAEVSVTCRIPPGNHFCRVKSSEVFPEESIEFSLDPVADKVVLTPDSVFFRRYNRQKNMFETVSRPPLSPVVIDFLFRCYSSKEKKVPCILSKEYFGDILDVEEPHTRMYFYPGITSVPFARFPEILTRAQERNLPIELKRIDPNSLGRYCVLVAGVEINEYGRPK